jgi:N-acetylglucosaminyldiphosphoundecaprenol N-acetyl-beta-D-mannosaminyltransferase
MTPAIRPPSRLRLGRVPVDRVTFREALGLVAGMVEAGRGGAVFTPNVDHVVMAAEDDRLRRAYDAVDLSLADGMPVVWASRLLGSPLPEKVSGSDLVPSLMQLAEARGFRVYLLGGAPGVADLAARRLSHSHPGLVLAGTLAPRVDMDAPAADRAWITGEVRRAAPDLVLVGLGAPKQEIWIHEVKRALAPAVLLGVGASLDFLAGTARRAPRWMSENGLEWAYRLAREPRRLFRRYLLRDPKFLGIVLAGAMRRGEAWP